VNAIHQPAKRVNAIYESIGPQVNHPRILYEKSLNLKTISQGDCGHFRENNLIILSKVAKIALRDVFKFKLFSYKIHPRLLPGSQGQILLHKSDGMNPRVNPISPQVNALHQPAFVTRNPNPQPSSRLQLNGIHQPTFVGGSSFTLVEVITVPMSVVWMSTSE